MIVSRLTVVVVLLTLASTLTASAQPQPAPAGDSALRAALVQHHATLSVDSAGRIGGAGGAMLVDAGRQARFFLVGEEHGVAENPRLVGALFRALAPAGYRHLAIETGDAVAAELNRRALGADPAGAITGFVTEYYPGVPFYNLREEAHLLAGAVAAAGRRPDVLWGLDYDVMADRYALRRLRAIAPNASARAAADRAIAVGDSMLDAALAAGNPATVFAFAGSAPLVAELRRAYAPAPGSEAERILDNVDETLRINRLWVEGHGYESNVARSSYLKRQFMRKYQAARAASRASPAREAPRVMLKFGASHMIRGRTFANSYDIGSLAAELAEAEGASAFGVMVIGGRESRHAQFDPRTFGYSPAPGEYAEQAWAKPFYDSADAAQWTVFDLRRLRPLLSDGRLGQLPARTTQVIYGFDALVILTRSHPSQPLVSERPRK